MDEPAATAAAPVIRHKTSRRVVTEMKYMRGPWCKTAPCPSSDRTILETHEKAIPRQTADDGRYSCQSALYIRNNLLSRCQSRASGYCISAPPKTVQGRQSQTGKGCEEDRRVGPRRRCKKYFLCCR